MGDLHAEEAQLAPGGHGELADENFLGGGGGLVLGFEGVEQGFEIGGVFAQQDEGFGGEAVLDAVETDGGAAFGRFRARAFLRVLAVGGDLSFGGHIVPF